MQKWALPEGTRRVGRPAVRWMDSDEEEWRITGVTSLKRKSQDRDQWRHIVKEAKVLHGL
jgi:hypothetical protein